MRYSVVFVFLVTTGISALAFIHLNNTCLQIHNQSLSYQDSSEFCKKQGLVLHSVQNDWEMNAMKPYLKEKGNYWVASSEVDGVFKWGDGRICCPKSWWGPGEPETGEKCARLWYGGGELHLYGRTCNVPYEVMCSKPADTVWSLVNIMNYDFVNLCGVEIIPNCEGLTCPEACDSHSNCNQVATMSNVCVNIKNSSQTDKCVLKMTYNMKLYRKVFKCN